MRQVEMYRPGDTRGAYCLSDEGRRAILIDLEMYRAALEVCNGTISVYNAGPK